MENNKKRYVPWPLIAILGVLLPITIVFGTTFILGLHTGKYPVGPWTNLMLFTASCSLVAVDIVGIIEICMGLRKERKG